MTGVDALARMLPSLAIIVGALLLLRHWAQKGRGGTTTPLRVISRTGLAKGSVVAIVEVGDRRLLVGAADQSVSLLAELDDVPTAVVDGPSPATATDETDRTSAPAVVPATDRQRLLDQLRPALPTASLTPTDDRPRMAAIDRLRHMTVRSPVRTHPSRPNRAHSRP